MKAALPFLCFWMLFTSIDDINATGHNNRSDIVARYKGLAQKPAGNHHAGNGHEGAEDSNFADGIVAEQLVVYAKAKCRNENQNSHDP